MVDTCTIRRRTRSSDPVTGVSTPTDTTVYTGKCRVQQVPMRAEPIETGQDHVLLLRMHVHLPIAGSTGLQAGDAVVITAAGRDPDLVGRVFVIHDLAHKTDATARRVGALERTD